MLIAALFITTTAAVYFYNESEYRRRLYLAARIDAMRNK